MKRIGILLCIALLTLLLGCTKTPDLVGTWECITEVTTLGDGATEEVAASYVLKFNEDGTGTFESSYEEREKNTAQDFSYTLEEATLTLLYEDERADTFPITLTEDALTLGGRLNFEFSRVS